MKEWQKLCSYFDLVENKVSHEKYVNLFSEVEEDDAEETDEDGSDGEHGEIFEVSEILAVCYGDPNNKKDQGLYFKVVFLPLVFLLRLEL